jgi:hypothetical protein
MPAENRNRTFEWNSIEQGFKELQWVMRALSKDEQRRPLQCLHIDVDFIVATDGYRLHMASNDFNTPIGLWRPKTTSKKMVVFEEQLDMEFPEYERVLPTQGNHVREVFWVEEPRKGESWGLKLAYPFLQFLTYAKKVINLDYLTDILSLEGQWTIETEFNDDKYFRPVVAMRNEDCLAVVMPLKT